MREDLIIQKAKANLDAIPMVFAALLDLAGFNHLDERIHRLCASSVRLAHAEAGFFYLHKNQKLHLVSVQTSKTLRHINSHIFFYSKLSLNVDNSSLAGACAVQGRMVFVPNVAKTPKALQATFNPASEAMHNYKTKSMLNIPLIDEYQRLLGVMQLINCKNPPSADELEAGWLAMLQAAATQGVAQGIQGHSNLMRSLGIVQLHDPRETLGHVNRMGAYAAELYQTLQPDLPEDQLLKYRDMVRIGAMMHDLGKVAVPVAVLQKSGPLNLREFMQLQSHTIKGAGLFLDGDSELDRVCLEIVLNHHEHWDGSGYPGFMQAGSPPSTVLGSGKSGEDIPLSARITLLLDVYDTLSYVGKDNAPWPEAEVLAHIRAGSGRQFDPKVVEAFFAIYGVIKAIGAQYPD